IRTEYQCSTCEQRITVLFDEFTVLKIPIVNSKKNVLFENCLKEYIKPQLFENNIRDCSNCKCERSTIEIKTIYYPPEYLILAVDRFNLDTMEKNYTNVEPCLQLDFTPFFVRSNDISNPT
ncbi:ubiquitin-specific protease, partial [Reticulomyxa filosa]